MTDELERLANGVLWPGFFGTEAPAWLRDELREGLAGVVYFGQNVGEGLPALSAQILDANPNALIGIDEEGGSVTRLESATGSTVPGAAQLGLLDDLVASEETGAELARRVRAVGANVVLGPVADVNTDPATRSSAFARSVTTRRSSPGTWSRRSTASRTARSRRA